MKSHAKNIHTKSLIIKRDFSLNDIFYLCQYLFKNNSLRSLSLCFIESGAEKNSNAILNENANGGQPAKVAPNKNKKDPLVLVPSDKMEVTTSLFQPLGMLSHNMSIISKYNIERIYI